ncbi:hypothetical protein IWQ60_000044 [Tieghemiomyces parasiticus]|uniref:Membrane insertase YidC/Oxa/ALB C-terminal domain-containing protein n=1 Tax=Tieghemiomyces parasiticus TaxID=78921 RepID=A0A9W8AFL6_9FUNG|nr:hypothetical protein IWQ60_000044 [Tieghemiomyces parasiticus]
MQNFGRLSGLLRQARPQRLLVLPSATATRQSSLLISAAPLHVAALRRTPAILAGLGATGTFRRAFSHSPLRQDTAEKTLAAAGTPEAAAEAVKAVSPEAAAEAVKTLSPEAAADAIKTLSPDLAAAEGALDAVFQAAIPKTLQLGELAAKYDLIHFTPVGGFEKLTELLSVATGFPMWGVIVTATIMFRTILLPFTIRQQGMQARMTNIQPQTQALTMQIKEATEAGFQNERLRLSQKMAELFKTHNCHPFATMGLSMLPIPFFISFFFAIRKMAEIPIPQLTVGGFGWVEDLSLVDPYYILPILSSLSTLLTLEIAARTTAAGVMSDPKMKWIIRAGTGFMAYFTSQFPAALLMYWCTSNFISIFQTFALTRPVMRARLGLPAIKKAKMVKKQPGMVDKLQDSVTDIMKKRRR